MAVVGCGTGRVFPKCCPTDGIQWGCKPSDTGEKCCVIGLAPGSDQGDAKAPGTAFGMVRVRRCGSSWVDLHFGVNSDYLWTSHVGNWMCSEQTRLKYNNNSKKKKYMYFFPGFIKHGIIFMLEVF